MGQILSCLKQKTMSKVPILVTILVNFGNLVTEGLDSEAEKVKFVTGIAIGMAAWTVWTVLL